MRPCAGRSLARARPHRTRRRQYLDLGQRTAEWMSGAASFVAVTRNVRGRSWNRRIGKVRRRRVRLSMKGRRRKVCRRRRICTGHPVSVLRRNRLQLRQRRRRIRHKSRRLRSDRVRHERHAALVANDRVPQERRRDEHHAMAARTGTLKPTHAGVLSHDSFTIRSMVTIAAACENRESSDSTGRRFFSLLRRTANPS